MYKEYESARERYSFLSFCIAHKNSSLLFCARIVKSVTEDIEIIDANGTAIEKSTGTVVTAEIRDLKRLLHEEITHWRTADKLSSHVGLDQILSAWKYVLNGNSTEVCSFVQQLLESQSGLLDLVSGFLHFESSYDPVTGAAIYTPFIKPAAIGEFANLDVVVSQLRELGTSECCSRLDDHRQIAVKTLLAAVDNEPNSESEQQGPESDPGAQERT